MTQAQRHAALHAIAEHLTQSASPSAPAHNVSLFRGMGADETKRCIEDLEAAGLITVHQGVLRGGRRSLILQLTDHGKATLHDSPSQPDQPDLRDRWHDRDLPVLIALARAEEARTDLPLDTLLERTGLQSAEARESVNRLIREGYVDHARFTWDNQGRYTHCRLTETGLRAVQVWPSPDTGAERLLAALEHLAEHATDEPTRTRGRAALAQLGGLSRDTLAGVAAAVLTGMIPIQ